MVFPPGSRSSPLTRCSSRPSGRACDLRALTAVGYASGTALLGASCDQSGSGGDIRPGRSPLASDRPQGTCFVVPAGRCRGPWLAPLAPGGGPSSTVGPIGRRRDAPRGRLDERRGNVAGIAPFAARTARAARLVWAGRRQWSRSCWRPSPMAKTSWPSPTERSSGWHQLSAPPPGTATVAFGPGTNVAALAASSTVLTVWALHPGATKWVKPRSCTCLSSSGRRADACFRARR